MYIVHLLTADSLFSLNLLLHISTADFSSTIYTIHLLNIPVTFQWISTHVGTFHKESVEKVESFNKFF